MITKKQIREWRKPVVWAKGSGHWRIVKDDDGNEVGRIPMGHALTQPEMDELCRLALIGLEFESRAGIRR